VLKRLENYVQPSDEQQMIFDFDFVGIQNYTREIVKYNFWVPFIKASLIKAADRDVAVSAMGWEIFPESIYHMLKKYSQYQLKSIIITENGLALSDEFHAGAVNDHSRIQYVKQILKQVHRAQQEGIPVDGYFYWTFIDNFEWAEGYFPKFGLVYNHHLKQERIVKNSGLWWQAFLN
jgi:beta-glucosidase